MIEFEKRYKIPVYDTDFQGKLSIFSLFNYIQDIASEHAEILHFGRDDLQRNDQFWILSRVYAEIKSFPFWGETLILRTWPRGTDGMFALRDIEIRSEKWGVIAGATTSWVIVNAINRRPQRPETLLERMNLEFPSSRSTTRNAGKLTQTSSFEPAQTNPFHVMASDLDVNYHVNNVKYIQWVYNTRSVQFLSKNEATSVEVNYLSEAVEGNKIIIESINPDQENNCSAHSVIRLDDARELCRLRICWHQTPNQKVL